MTQKDRLGFIGLGVMGGRMCRNLATKSGRTVVGFDVDPDRIAALTPSPASAASSVEDLVSQTDIVFMCVPGEPQVREVCFGSGALAATSRLMATVAVVMSTSTCPGRMAATRAPEPKQTSRTCGSPGTRMKTMSV